MAMIYNKIHARKLTQMSHKGSVERLTLHCRHKEILAQHTT